MLTLVALAMAGTAIAAEDPPPEHKQWMKDLGAQMGAIRKGVDVEKNAQAMADVLPSVGKFWKARNSEIALKSCGQSRKGALAVVAAAKASDQAGIAAGMKEVGAGCKGCHDAHREKVGENEYKIK